MADPSPTWLPPQDTLRDRFPGRKAIRAACAGAILTVSLAAVSLAQTQQPLAATSASYWPRGGVSRFAIQTAGQSACRACRLTNPQRIYFDVSRAANRVGAKPRLQHVIPVGDGLVKQIRVAEPQK